MYGIWCLTQFVKEVNVGQTRVKRKRNVPRDVWHRKRIGLAVSEYRIDGCERFGDLRVAKREEEEGV